MTTEFDRRIAQLAAQQHGVFSRAQAAALGCSRRAVARRVAAGCWVERTPRVLAAAGAPRTERADAMTAVLHADAVAVSHRAAAALHGLPGFRLAEVHVIVRADRHPGAPSGVVVHRCALADGEVVRLRGIPATTVARTLLDLAAGEHPKRVERALDNALAMRLTSVRTVQVAVDGAGPRRGVRLMRRLLAARQGEYVPPASELEARFLDLVRAAGLPEPERQVPVGDGQELAGRVDMVWRDERLVAELDSRRHHSALLDVQNDVRRDVVAARGGWRVLRITWEDVFASPDRTIVRLTASLDQASMRRRAG